MAIMGHEAVALTLVGIDVVGLAAVFVVGRLAPKSNQDDQPEE